MHDRDLRHRIDHRLEAVDTAPDDDGPISASGLPVQSADDGPATAYGIPVTEQDPGPAPVYGVPPDGPQLEQGRGRWVRRLLRFIGLSTVFAIAFPASAIAGECLGLDGPDCGRCLHKIATDDAAWRAFKQLQDPDHDPDTQGRISPCEEIGRRSARRRPLLPARLPVPGDRPGRGQAGPDRDQEAAPQGCAFARLHRPLPLLQRGCGGSHRGVPAAARYYPKGSRPFRQALEEAIRGLAHLEDGSACVPYLWRWFDAEDPGPLQAALAIALVGTRGFEPDPRQRVMLTFHPAVGPWIGQQMALPDSLDQPLRGTRRLRTRFLHFVTADRLRLYRNAISPSKPTRVDRANLKLLAELEAEAPPEEYLACGCGCGSVTTPGMERCVASRDELVKIIAADRRARKDPHCAVVGPSLGTLFKVCPEEGKDRSNAQTP